MINRQNLMRSAWAQYRRETRHGVAFDRAAFAAILRQRWFAARLLADRAGIMAAAWARYRVAAVECRCDCFDRRLFARVLRFAWINARAALAKATAARRVVRPAPIVLPSALETALETVRYLPAHMSAARAEATIRARYATA